LSEKEEKIGKIREKGRKVSQVGPKTLLGRLDGDWNGNETLSVMGKALVWQKAFFSVLCGVLASQWAWEKVGENRERLPPREPLGERG